MSKRVETTLSTKEHASLKDLAEQRGQTASHVMRVAVCEMMEREAVAERLTKSVERVEWVAKNINRELADLRRELIGDQLKAFGVMRDDIDRAIAGLERSAQKNENVNKEFLLALTQPQPKQAKPAPQDPWVPSAYPD